jgi:hypothetical protein
MPTNKFPSPGISHLIDEDSQIVKVPLDYMDTGARKSALPKNVKNQMTLSHVGKEQGPARIESDVKSR